MKETKNKKVKLIIAVLILCVLFICSGIFIKSTVKTREEKILSYLEKAYDTKFEIVSLNWSGEKIIFPGIGCDGSTFCPEIKDEETICYKYDVLEVENNITFELYYEDKKFNDKIEAAYFKERYGEEILNEVATYIVDLIGDEDSEIEYWISELPNDKYRINGGVQITLDQDLDSVLNKQYIEEKLRKISTYLKKKCNMDEDVLIEVEVNFNKGLQLWFYHRNALPLIRDITKENYNEESCNPYEYLERQEIND